MIGSGKTIAIFLVALALAAMAGLAAAPKIAGGKTEQHAFAASGRQALEAVADTNKSAPPDAGGFIIPTMSFDARVPDYSKLASIEPGLPIKDYFDDFFPFQCVWGAHSKTKQWISARFDLDAPSDTIVHERARLAYKTCRAQTAVVCSPTRGEPSGVFSPNQGILLRLLTDDSKLSCGVVTTAHGWQTMAQAGQSGYYCLTTAHPARRSRDAVVSLSTLKAPGRSPSVFTAMRFGLIDSRDAHSELSDVLADPYRKSYYREFVDVSRVELIYEAANSGLFGGTGYLTTDLEYEGTDTGHCSQLDGYGPTFRLSRFDDVRALSSVAALRSNCDLGIMICASPPSGQADDQKRCSHYLPEELGREGDVYDFRSLVNGKGIVRHYGTSFKGLSGAGHYCLRTDYEPIPFGMSVAVRTNPEGIDRETYSQWLGLYITQGSRERDEYVVVQHLANLADFQEFRTQQGLD